MSRLTPIVLVLLLVAAGGCTSTVVNIDTPPAQAGEKVLGPTEGSAVGIMLLQFIPIQQNTRFERACGLALDRIQDGVKVRIIEICAHILQ